MTVRQRAWALAPIHFAGALLILGLARGGDARAEPSKDKDKESVPGTANVHGSLETSTYADTDHVLVVSPTIALGIEDPVNGWSASGRYLVDAVSAASADIVSTASPRWHEVRHVGSLEGSYKPGDFGISPRVSISREPDYLSLGAGLQLNADLLEKSLNVAFGYGYGHDTMSIGSTPFSVYSKTLDRHGFNVSAASVIDRATRLTVIGDVIVEQGELAKLYRFVPVFSPTNAPKVPQGATLDQINALRSDERVAENVPGGRIRYALTMRIAHRFSGWTLRADERGYVDNWGMKASTTDLRCMADASSRVTLWPHFRAHVQGSVSFWQRVYQVTTDSGSVRHVPTWITGNRELGPQHSFTVGGGVAWALGPDEDVARRKLTFVVDGIGTWYTDSLFLQSRYGVFSAVTFDTAFD